MADLTSLKQLDTVLNSLKGHPDEINLYKLKKMLIDSGSDFNTNKLLKLVHKLIDDGLVREYNFNEFTILQQGVDFEGYELQYLSTVSENNRLDTLENELKENRRWTLYLTVLIAVGTLVAGVYYSILIYKELHSFSHRHGIYWIWETIPKKKP